MKLTLIYDFKASENSKNFVGIAEDVTLKTIYISNFTCNINTCKPNQNQNIHFWKVRCLKNKATTNLSNFSLKLRLCYLRRVKYFSWGLKVY